MNRRAMDMTKGPILKQLIVFTIPMLIGNLFQQLYNMVDTIVIGQQEGSNALAAVGATGSICFFFNSFAFGMGAGIGVIVAQYIGAGDERYVKKTIGNAIYVVLSVAVVMSTLGAGLAEVILRALGTPEELLADAVLYMRVACIGIIAIAAYNAISSILRALGDSVTPLIFLIVASAINVGLDLLFVVQFGWSVFGVALATIIAQMISAIGSLIYAYKRIPYFRISREYYKPDRKLIRQCFRIGIPVSLQNSMIAVSCIALQAVVNSFKEIAIAANTAVSRFDQLIQQPYSSLGAALVTFTGQNMGAGNIDRVRKGFRKGMLICGVFSLILFPIGFFGGRGIMHIFVSEEPVIELGVRALRINVCFYFLLGMIYVARSVLNGAGDTAAALLNGIVEVACRVGFAYPLTMIPQIGVMGIWWTTVSTWTVTGIIVTGRYLSGKWKTKAIVHRKN